MKYTSHKAMALKFYELAQVGNSSLHKAKEHFVSGEWNNILDFPSAPMYNQVMVYEDFSSALYWADKIGVSNVSYYHAEACFTKEVAKNGITTYMNLNAVPKNIPQVGNPAFSIAEDVINKLPFDQEICMVMPAWVAIAPNWKAQSWATRQKIKKHLEDIGLKEVLWIPNGSFDQFDGVKKDTAQVDSVLVITEPGYTGDITVTNLLDGSSYQCIRGSVYPRKLSTLGQIEPFKQGNQLKFREDQKKDNIAKKWSIGVNIYNPYAKGKGANGCHLKGLQLFAPGDTIKKNTCFQEFDTEIEARTILAHLTSDVVAQAYQDLTTQKSFSSVMLRMLKA